MRRETIAALLMAGLLWCTTGCGRDEGDLYGTWTLDTKRTLKQLKKHERFQALTQAGRNAATKEFRRRAAAIKVTFKETGLDADFGEFGFYNDGEWKVRTTEGDHWKLAVKDDDEEWQVTTLGWIDEDHIWMQNEDTDQKLYFVRRE